MREVEKCCSPRACVRQHVLDGLLGIVLVRHTVFIMVVGGAFQMHFSMHRLELALVVERSRLAGRCEGLAEEGAQQDDCEQSAHEIGSRQLKIRRNDSRRLLPVSQKPTSNTWYQGSCSHVQRHRGIRTV